MWGLDCLKVGIIQEIVTEIRRFKALNSVHPKTKIRVGAGPDSWLREEWHLIDRLAPSEIVDEGPYDYLV